MKTIDSIPAEKLEIFHKAAFEIIKDHLQEDVAVGVTHSLSEGRDEPNKKRALVHTFCDGYRWGMSTAMALMEAGILNMTTLEIQTKEKNE